MTNPNKTGRTIPKLSFITQNASTIAIGIICLIVLFVTTNINWGDKNKNLNIIRSDAKCYYLYLPGIFIYHDLSFSFTDQIENKTYFDKFNCRDCREYINGKVFSKVTAGTAIAQLPFFLAAHLYAKFSGYPADGYSRPYQLVFTLAALFYLFLGLWFLDKLIQTYIASAASRILMMLCCVFGTNLFYYTIGEPGLSHIYSFAFINILAYYTRRFFLYGQSRYLIYFGIVSGMVFLIRPVNLIVLPGLLVFANDFNNLKQKLQLLRKRVGVIALAIFVFLAFVAVQSLIFKLQTGYFWIYSYGNETFNFSKPEILNILFSYKKGLLLYTPMYLLSLFGFFFMFKKQKCAFILLPIFLFLFTYVVSSWWNWWYGGSFSSRVYVDILVFFMLPLAFLIDSMQTKIRKTFLIIGLFLIIAMCQIQTYQYRYYIIHWDSMTKQRYWDNFLRIDKL
ncbi:MAG: hypothetical protein WCQ95_04885 [Bacteroidota bacterium]